LDDALAHPEVQRLGGNVGAVGPDDRPQLLVELDSGEVGRILERGKDAVPRLGAEIQLALGSVLEAQQEPVPPPGARQR
jgi:hypothetical protein